MKAKESAPSRRFNAVVTKLVKARAKLASAEKAYLAAMAGLKAFKA